MVDVPLNQTKSTLLFGYLFNIKVDLYNSDLSFPHLCSFEQKSLLLLFYALMASFFLYQRDGFPMKYKWQQFSSGLFYVIKLILAIVWSWWFLLFTNIPFIQPLVEVFWNYFKGSKHHYHPYVPQILQLSGKIQVFANLFVFFSFYCVLCWNDKIQEMVSSFFLLYVNCKDFASFFSFQR